MSNGRYGRWSNEESNADEMMLLDCRAVEMDDSSLPANRVNTTTQHDVTRQTYQLVTHFIDFLQHQRYHSQRQLVQMPPPASTIREMQRHVCETGDEPHLLPCFASPDASSARLRTGRDCGWRHRLSLAIKTSHHWLSSSSISSSQRLFEHFLVLFPSTPQRGRSLKISLHLKRKI